MPENVGPEESGVVEVGTVASRSGNNLRVLYDNNNKFVGIEDTQGQFMLLNENESEQLIALLTEANRRAQSTEENPRMRGT